MNVWVVECEWVLLGRVWELRACMGGYFHSSSLN